MPLRKFNSMIGPKTKPSHHRSRREVKAAEAVAHQREHEDGPDVEHAVVHGEGAHAGQNHHDWQVMFRGIMRALKSPGPVELHHEHQDIGDEDREQITFPWVWNNSPLWSMNAASSMAVPASPIPWLEGDHGAAGHRVVGGLGGDQAVDAAGPVLLRVPGHVLGDRDDQV